MSFPYTEEMMESVKKVEATRAARMAAEPRRMTAEEKDALLEQYHPDYNLSSFAEIIVGPNKGEKAPIQPHAGATVRHRAAYERATLSDGRQGDADPHEDPRGA